MSLIWYIDTERDNLFLPMCRRGIRILGIEGTDATSCLKRQVPSRESFCSRRWGGAAQFSGEFVAEGSGDHDEVE